MVRSDHYRYWRVALVTLRGLFSRTQPAMLSRFLSPEAAVVIATAGCFLIEAAQYFRSYQAHYDPLDLLAYVSLVVPCYAADRWLLGRRRRSSGIAG